MAKTTTDLATLKINLLSLADYEAEVQAGTVEPDELYLTPASGTGVTDVRVDGTSVVTGGVAAVDLTGKANASHTHTKSQITDFPTIPTITDTYSSTSSNGMSGKAVKSAIDALDGTITGSAGASKTLTAFSQTDGKVSATFSSISITKSQISDFPAIPTVNNATLTIQKNGTNVNTFTANASSNVTANITVPSKVSELSNDSGFISSYTETDPVFTSSPAYGISASDITDWDNAYDGKIAFNSSAASGTTDGDLYSAIVALGWASDVVE